MTAICLYVVCKYQHLDIRKKAAWRLTIKVIWDLAPTHNFSPPESGVALRWPNTVLARALADVIHHVHKDCKNKHAVDTAIIFCAQCSLYLCYFSS